MDIGWIVSAGDSATASNGLLHANEATAFGTAHASAVIWRALHVPVSTTYPAANSASASDSFHGPAQFGIQYFDCLLVDQRH